MDHSTPGLPVHHQLPEFTQTHVHQVSDAIPPSPPLLSLSPPAFSLSNESALCIRWPNIGVTALKSVLSMDTQDWSPLGWTGWISLQSKGHSRVFSRGTLSASSDVYVRNFLYLFYNLIKLYYTKALSDQPWSLSLDWILLLWRPRILVSFVIQQQPFILGAHLGLFRTR